MHILYQAKKKRYIHGLKDFNFKAISSNNAFYSITWQTLGYNVHYVIFIFPSLIAE